MITEGRTATILLYHGVTRAESIGVENEHHIHIEAAEFERQMRFIKDHATPLSLPELVARLNGFDELPEKCVAVTFDDAAKNLHDVAMPLLEKLQIPATAFLATGFIGNNRRFWTAQVEHMVNMTPKTEITLSWQPSSVYFSLGSGPQKLDAIRQIKTMLKTIPATQRNRCIEDLRQSTEIYDNADSVSNYQSLSWDDVVEMANSAWFHIGGHTVNHEIMTSLSESDLDYEINTCIKELELHLERPVNLFSYPEGQSAHFNDLVIGKLKLAGIDICPTAIKGTNPVGTGPFLLKRVMVGLYDEPFPFGEYYA